MKKLTALLLAMLLLASFCACGEQKKQNENEIPKEEEENKEENKEEEVDYTQIQDSDKAVVCYVGQTCTSKDTGTIVIVSYDPSDDTVMKVMDYSYKVDGSFPTGFLTNTIIDDWFYDDADMYDAQARLISISKPIDKFSSRTLACVSFVGKYELETSDKETAFTTENGYTCYKVSSNYNQYQYYVLDIGLANYYVHVEQCNSDAENYGTEFQNLKFEIILDK